MTSQPFSKDPILSSLIEKHQLKEYWGGQNSLFLNLVEITFSGGAHQIVYLNQNV